MKKLIIIVSLFFTLDVTAFAQLTSFNGEIRYQHQYQDILSGTTLSTSIRRSPVLNLNSEGNIFAREIGQFFASTSLNGNFNSASTGEYFVNNRQFLWDYYNVILLLLPNSFVQLNLRAREGMIDSKTEFGTTLMPIITSRRQEQGFTASTNRIKFLPTTSFSYQRTREWSFSQEPYDRKTNSYSLSLATSGGGSSLNLSGTMNERIEQFSQARERDYNLIFNGTKDFNETDKIDLSSEFERYGNYSTLSASASYGGALSQSVNLFSSVGGRNSASPNYALRYLNTSHGVHITHDEHFQTTLNFSARTGSELFASSGIEIKNKNYDWNLGGGLSHGRTLGFGTFSNSLSLGVGQQKYGELRQSYFAGVGNGIQTKIGTFSVSLNHNLSYSAIVDGYKRYEVGNSARGTINGTVWYGIRSQTTVDYHDQRYTGTLGSLRNRRTLQAREMLNGSFYYYIPFSLGVGGTVSWYFGEQSQHSYGLNFTFSSGRFFVPSLSVMYRYNRSYDLYFGRLIIEQSADIRYQWRALRFDLSLRESRLLNRRRELVFTVSRPF